MNASTPIIPGTYLDVRTCTPVVVAREGDGCRATWHDDDAAFGEFESPRREGRTAVIVDMINRGALSLTAAEWCPICGRTREECRENARIHTGGTYADCEDAKADWGDNHEGAAPVSPGTPYDQFQRATAAKWCLGQLMIGGCPCARLCAGCKRNANQAINANWCQDNPDATFAPAGRPGAWHLNDVVVFGPDQRGEHEAELARRRARLDLVRAQADGRDVDPGLVKMLVTA